MLLMLDITTMLAPSLICFFLAHCFTNSTNEKKFTSITFEKASFESTFSGLRLLIPAQCTRPSNLPYLSTTRATVSETILTSVRSIVNGMHFLPPIAVVSAKASVLTSIINTVAPSLASTHEVSRPIPEPAPVTIIIFPVNSIILIVTNSSFYDITIF